mmetsp:Transcript_831/g.2654  ORF Transcript_831/g.2654 Transcript_831/m.2654 type:complete len:246 (-) Transcript_831:461-1198(-)
MSPPSRTIVCSISYTVATNVETCSGSHSYVRLPETQYCSLFWFWMSTLMAVRTRRLAPPPTMTSEGCPARNGSVDVDIATSKVKVRSCAWLWLLDAPTAGPVSECDRPAPARKSTRALDASTPNPAERPRRTETPRVPAFVASYSWPAACIPAMAMDMDTSVPSVSVAKESPPGGSRSTVKIKVGSVDIMKICGTSSWITPRTMAWRVKSMRSMRPPSNARSNSKKMTFVNGVNGLGSPTATMCV